MRQVVKRRMTKMMSQRRRNGYVLFIGRRTLQWRYYHLTISFMYHHLSFDARSQLLLQQLQASWCCPHQLQPLDTHTCTSHTDLLVTQKRVRLLSLPLQLKKLEQKIVEATTEDKKTEAVRQLNEYADNCCAYPQRVVCCCQKMDFRDRKIVLNHRRQARQVCAQHNVMRRNYVQR